MKIEIKNRTKNIFFHREEITFLLTGVPSTPSRNDVRKLVAAQLSADENLLIVDLIDHAFGQDQVTGTARKYDTPEDLKKSEPLHQQKRNHVGAGAPAPATPAAEGA
ncbi:MAG: 30S ribosomal protein S24e [archaeon]